MVGTFADVVVADAIIKDIPGFDLSKAVAAIRKDSFEVINRRFSAADVRLLYCCARIGPSAARGWSCGERRLKRIHREGSQRSQLQFYYLLSSLNSVYFDNLCYCITYMYACQQGYITQTGGGGETASRTLDFAYADKVRIQFP